MKLINIGFGNLVAAERVVAITSPDSAPIKRLVQDAKEEGRVIDASCGRPRRPHHGFRPCDPLRHSDRDTLEPAGSGGR